MDDPSALSFKEEFEMMANCWKNCRENHKKGEDGMSLNKLLLKTCRNLSVEEKMNYLRRRLQYQFHARKGTKYEMSNEAYDEKLGKLKNRSLRVQLEPGSDNKFRYHTQKFEIFWTYYPLIQSVLDSNLEVKRFVLGDDKGDFKWSAEFMHEMREAMIQHKKEVSRAETNSEMTQVSIWTLCDSIFNFALCDDDDGKQPISDPMKS